MRSFLPAMLSVSYKLQQPVTGVLALKLIMDVLEVGGSLCMVRRLLPIYLQCCFLFPFPALLLLSALSNKNLTSGSLSGTVSLWSSKKSVLRAPRCRSCIPPCPGVCLEPAPCSRVAAGWGQRMGCKPRFSFASFLAWLLFRPCLKSKQCNCSTSSPPPLTAPWGPAGVTGPSWSVSAQWCFLVKAALSRRERQEVSLHVKALLKALQNLVYEQVFPNL